jgi:hypothetical protein
LSHLARRNHCFPHMRIQTDRPIDARALFRELGQMGLARSGKELANDAIMHLEGFVCQALRRREQ